MFAGHLRRQGDTHRPPSVNIDDARRIARGFEEAAHGQDDDPFSVGARRFAWPWMERVDPKRARVPNESVLAVRRSDDDKRALIDLDPTVFFTEPHYDGYAAVLVRLDIVDEEVLTKLLLDARNVQAAKPRQPPPRSPVATRRTRSR